MATTQSARINALEAQIAALTASVTALTAKLDTAAPAAAPAPTPAPARRTRKAAAPKACLTRSNRKAFVADNAWAQGLSVLEIAVAVAQGAKISGAWKIGERNAERASIAA